jgi:hypothetical protein
MLVDCALTIMVQRLFNISGSCSEARVHESRTTKFCTLVPYVCGSTLWNVVYFTVLAPRITRWLLDFFEKFVPLFGNFCFQISTQRPGTLTV